MSVASLRHRLVAAALAAAAIAAAAVLVRAATVIDAIAVNPAQVVAGAATPVTITATITDASVVATSVSLVRTDAEGRTLANVGLMNDTGSQGDAAAGDKVFTHIVTINQAAPGTLYFRASAAFRGVVLRQMSTVVPVSIVSGAPVNQAPTVTLAPTQTITLPAGATLTGTINDDGLPTPVNLTAQWTKQLGPGDVVFANASAGSTTATFSVAGTYVLRLTANDSALTGYAEQTVTVEPAAPVNQAPTVTLAPTQTITLPADATLTGTVNDDGLPTPVNLTAQWTKQLGPGDVAFANASAASTTATFSVAGTYVLRLTANDGALTGYAEQTVTVEPAAPVNQAPTVTLAPTQTITLPAGATLTGTVNDDALPTPVNLTAQWTKQLGPGDVVFANASAVSTTATFSVAGTYVLRLTANDGALTGYAEQTVTVEPAAPVNQAPTVTSNDSQIITLPATASISGTVQDDGLPAGAQVTSTWSKFSGPGSVTFGNDRATSTTASFSEPGTYVLRLSASDTELVGFVDISIRIFAAPTTNSAPAVSITTNSPIELPALASLTGRVTDDGLPAGAVTQTWTKMAGPGTVTFEDVTAASTRAEFSLPGTYQLRLTANDGEKSASADLQVVVNAPAAPENAPPAVTITTNSPVTLPGAASVVASTLDDGLPTGSSVAGEWSKVSGPGAVSFGAQGSASTSAMFGAPGTYVIRFTASDGDKSGSGEATVVVGPAPPANLAPVVSAGTDLTVLLPARASLAGTASDDGLVNPELMASWDKVSGPGDVTFSPAASLQATASFTQPGSYVLRLVVNDGALAGSDEVNVVVSAPAITNTAPAVDAGADQQIAFGAGATLSGTVNDDGQPGSPLIVSWLKTSGPGEVSFTSSQTTATQASFTAAGVYVLQLSVSDGEFTSADEVAITVNEVPGLSDRAPPVITLHAPKTALPGTAVKIEAQVSDDVALSKVRIEFDGQPPVELTVAPFVAEFTIAQFATPGQVFQIHGTATDASDNVAQATISLEISATPDTEPPTVTLSGAAVTAPGKSVRLVANAADDNGVDSVTFAVNGVDVVTDHDEPYEITYVVPAEAQPGTPLAARATAKDFAGNAAESTISIDVVATVVPIPPQITLTVPPTAAPGEELTLSADATDLDGIASVVFTHGLATLAADTTAPYSTTFIVPADAVPGSTLAFKAEAADLTDEKASDTRSVAVVAAPTLTRGVISGEVYDDATSLPLADVIVRLRGIDRSGVPYSETATTDARGRFVIQAVGGNATVDIEKSGWTRAERRLTIVGGQAFAMFDARLTRLGPSTQTIAAASGGTLTLGESTVTFGSGALAGASAVRLATTTQQGLEGALPTGWTPIAVADLFPHDVTFSGPAALKIRRVAGSGVVAPLLVRWDTVAGAWRLVGAGLLTADGLFLQAAVERSGQYAFVLPDTQPLSPKVPPVGAALPGVGDVVLPQALTTTIAPAPSVLFYQPGIGSDVRTTLAPQTAVSSGAIVAARLTESYRFLSGKTASPELMTEDLVAYQDAGDGVPVLAAAMRVTPSLDFEALVLEQGVIAVEMIAGHSAAPGELATAQGGTISTPGGEHSLTIPPGALADGTLVSLAGLSVSEFGAPLPSGIAFLGGARVSTSQTLARAATLSIPVPAGLTNVSRVLLVRSQEIGGQTRARLVGIARVEGGRLISDTAIGGAPTALEGVRSAGRYGFIQADGPVGFAGGVVTGISGAPAPGALVTSDTLFVVSLSNTTGAYLAAAIAGNNTITATELVRNDYVTRPAYLPAGQVFPLALAMVAQPPRVTSVTPATGSANVPLSGPIVVTFSEPIDPGSINGAAVSLTGPGSTSVDIVRALSQGNTVLTVRPAAPLVPDTRYGFALTTALTDFSGYGLESALSIAFDSIDTSAPPPPPAGSLSASVPNAQGLTTVAGTQGTAAPTDRVFIDNLTRKTLTVALVQANGGFSAQIAAGIRDVLQVRIVDAAGNETRAPLPAFKTLNPDGSVSQAVSADGGIIEGPGGSQARVKPGTFPNGALVTINYVAPADFPIQLPPESAEDFTLDGGVSIDFGGETPQLYVDLSIPARGGETEAMRWIVVAAEELDGQMVMNAIDTGKFRGDRITTASPPCPGVQAARTYGFVRSKQTVGLSYSNVFVGVGKGLLMGLKWQFTGGPFGLAPFGVHADPFSEALCYPVLTGNVTLIQNTVRVSIPARLLAPADRQLIVKNMSVSLPPVKVPRDVKEYTLDVEGQTSDSYRIEAKGFQTTGGGAPANQLLTKFSISNLAEGRVRLRVDPDPVTIAVASIEVRNLTRDKLSTFTQPLDEPFAAQATGGNGDSFEVTVVDVNGRTRKLDQQYTGDNSLYGDGNLVLKAVEASIDPTREEMDSAGVGGPARTEVFVADLTQAGVFQPIPKNKIVRGGIRGAAFHGDPTHDYAILVKYDQRGDYLQRLPRMQIDVRNAKTGEVLKTIDAFAPPPDEPQGLPDITDGDTRAPYVISGPARLSNFDPSGQLVFTFSEAMDPDSLKRAFEVKDSAGRILEGEVEVSGEGRVVRFVPAAALRSGEKYSVRIKGYQPSADGSNPGPSGGGSDAARDRRGNPVAEIALLINVFTPKQIGSYNGDGAHGVFKDVIVPPPTPIAVNPNPNQPGPGNDPTDQGSNRSRPVYVTTSHQTLNLVSLESRDPAELSFIEAKDGPISRQQGAFIRNVAFPRSGPGGGAIFSGDLLLTTTFNTNSSRLDWYDVTRRNDVDTFSLLGSKILTENPDLAGFANRNNTIFADGALAKGVDVLSGAGGVTAYTAVERVGILAASMSTNTPFRAQALRVKEGIYPGDFLDLDIEDGTIFAISRSSKELHVLDAGLGAMAVRPLQVNGKAYSPRKIEVRSGLQFDKNHDGFIEPDEIFTYAFIAADQAMLMVDVTDSSAPQITGVVALPGSVRDIDVDFERRRAFVMANGAMAKKIVDGQETQVDGYVAMIDVSDPTRLSGIDLNGDGLDDRVVWQEGAAGVNGIRIDAFRGVLFVAGVSLDTYAVYDLCCDLGVDLAPKPTAQVTGDRLTLAKLEKQAVANGLAKGIAKAVSECSIQPSDLKLLDLGSGACLWTSTDACGADYKPGLGSHDIAVFVSHAGLLVNGPGQDSGATCTLKRLAGAFVNQDTGLHEEIDVDGLKVKVENISFSAYHLSELQERAQYNIQLRDKTLPGQMLPDFGLGRQGLLMSHVLGGTWVDYVPGYGSFAGPSLDSVMTKLRNSRNLPIVEGHEQTRLAKYLMVKGQAYLRFPGASAETSSLNDLYNSQIAAAAAAGVKAAFGRLIVDVHGRDRLLAVSLNAVAANSVDKPVQVYGENACLTADPALPPEDWKEVGCTSFDHFIASQAAGTRRIWGTQPALDGSKPDRPELFDLERAQQVMRFYRVGAGFESIQSEADADAFIREVHYFIEWADGITKPFYDNRVADDPQNFQRVQNRLAANGGIVAEEEQTSLTLTPRVFNRGFSAAEDVALDMYVTRPGDQTPTAADTSVRVTVDAGTETFIEYRRNPDGTYVRDANGAATPQFQVTSLSQTARPGVLGWIAFAIDVPTKKQKEANRQNNIGGTYFYVLDRSPSASVPAGGGRVPSPVGDAALAGDDDCNPDPEVHISQGLRIGADGELLASPVRLEVGQVARLEVTATNKGSIGTSVTICNTLNGQCASLGTLGSEASGQTMIPVPTKEPATYDIITTAISPATGIHRQSPFRVSISCTPYEFVPLSHDPSTPSTVMRDGVSYRFYQLVNRLTGAPVQAATVKVEVTGERTGSATFTTNHEGHVGAVNTGAFREGIAIPFSIGSGGLEGTSKVTARLDRGDLTECAAETEYTLLFQGFESSHSMSAGTRGHIEGKLFTGKGELGGSVGMSFDVTQTVDRNGTKFKNFTVGRSAEIDAGLAWSPKSAEFSLDVGASFDASGPGGEAGFKVSRAKTDSYSFGDIQNLTEGDRHALVALLVDTIAQASPIPGTRFLVQQFQRRYAPQPRLASVGTTWGVELGAEAFLGKLRFGFSKNDDIPDGTGSTMIGGDMSFAAASVGVEGTFEISASEVDKTISGSVELSGAFSAKAGANFAMRAARDTAATEPDASKRHGALDAISDAFFGSGTATGGFGLSLDATGSGGISFTMPNLLPFDPPPPTDSDKFLASSLTLSLSEAVAYGYRFFGNDYTNQGAGSKFNYSFTATGKDFYKSVLPKGPLWQTLFFGNQRFALPEVSQPSGPIEVSDRSWVNAAGAFFSRFVSNGTWEQTVEYGNGLEFPIGIEVALLGTGGGAGISLTTNQSVSYPVRRGVARRNKFYTTETYPLHAVEAHSWTSLQNVAKNLTDPIVLEYVTKGNITPRPGGATLNVPNVAGLELASAGDASAVESAISVPFTAVPGPTAPAKPDPMGLTAAAGKPHFGVNGFVQFNAEQPQLTTPAHLTLHYSDDQVTPAEEQTLALYRWVPSGGAGSWTLVPSTIDRTTNVVEADVTILGSFTLAPRLPGGRINWTLVSANRAGDPNNPTTSIVVRSAPLTNNDGSPVGAGAVVHVRSLDPATAFSDPPRELGQIVTPDSDPLTDGVQLLTDANGQVTVQIQVVGPVVSAVHLQAFTDIGVASSEQQVVVP